MSTQRREEKSAPVRGGEKERPLAPLFYMSPPTPTPRLPYINWASQGCCLVLTRSLHLPLSYFHGLFSSLSFSHCHSGRLFPILTT